MLFLHGFVMIEFVSFSNEPDLETDRSRPPPHEVVGHRCPRLTPTYRKYLVPRGSTRFHVLIRRLFFAPCPLVKVSRFPISWPILVGPFLLRSFNLLRGFSHSYAAALVAGWDGSGKASASQCRVRNPDGFQELVCQKRQRWAQGFPSWLPRWAQRVANGVSPCVLVRICVGGTLGAGKHV